MTLAVIVPTINCVRYLKEMIESIQVEDISELIVIDNGSKDGTPDYLGALSLPTRVTRVRFPVNIGVAPAWNYGLDLAFDHGAEYAAVLNNDIVLAPDTLATLVRWAKDEVELPTVHAVPDLETAKRIEWVSRPGDFCGFLMTPDVLSRVGWFDVGYRLAYLEDLDYEMRLLQAGVSHGSCHDALVQHYGSRAIREGGVKHVDAFRANADYFVRKWGLPYEDGRRAIAASGPVLKRFPPKILDVEGLT